MKKQKKVKRRSIRSKLVTSFGFILIATVAIVFMNISANTQIGKFNKQLTAEMELAEDNQKMQVCFQQVQLYSNLCYTSYGTANESTMQDELQSKLDELRTDVEVMSAKAQEIDSEEINTAMENLVRAMNDFIDYCQGIYDTSVARNNVKCGALVNGMYDFVTVVDKRVESFQDELDTLNASVARHSAVRISGTTTFNCALLIVVAIFVIVVQFILVQTIAKPAKSAKKQLEELSQTIKDGHGELHRRIHIKSNDEIGDLCDGVNDFVGILEEVMGTITTVSSNVNTSIGMINQGIETSNENAGNISAVMEELASSMDMVSSSADQTAQGTADVDNAVADMADAAREGHDFVAEVKGRAVEARKGAQSRRQVINENISRQKEVMSSAIDESRKVKDIESLTEDILSIAAQTNLERDLRL